MKMTPSYSRLSPALLLWHSVVLLILTGCTALYAQQDSLAAAARDTLLTKSKPALPDTSTVDKMVVTGTRTLRSIKDNPANVTVITREHIDAAPGENVSDLLLYEPGVLVKRPVGMGEGVPSDIVMRGVPGATAATRTLILVDGIPTNAAGTPFLILNEVPMEAVEQVEVVRGPYSNLYGPNAIGGVVNIITKNPAMGIHGGINGAGYVNFYDVNADVNGGIGRFSFLADGSVRGTPNYYLSDSVRHRFGNNYRITNADNFGYYEKRYFGKYTYAFSSRATLTLNTRYFNSELGYGKTEYDPQTNISMLGQTFLVGPVLKVNITPSWDIRAGAYFRNLTGTYHNWGIRTDTIGDLFTDGVWKTSSNDWQIDGQSTLKLEKFGTLTAGFDLLDNAINFGPRYDAIRGNLLKDTYGANKAMMNGGLYVQDELRSWERLTTVAGLRFDYNSIFGIVPCPRLGFIYKQNPMFRLKVSAGRAFRAPSLAELYMPDMPINTSTTLLPDSSLKPEYIWSVDGGPEIDIMKWMSLRISGFYNSMDDLITQKVVNEYFQNIWLDTRLSHKNTEKAWSAGMENSLELRLNKWGSFFFNYTYTKSEDMQLHGQLEYIPEHQFNTGVYVKRTFGPITLSGSVLGNFVGKRDYLDWRVTLDSMQAGKIPLPPTPSDFNPSFVTLPGYFRIDASAKITYKNSFWLGVEGLNLTKEEIEEESGTYAPKRFIAARIGLQF